jgi:hypothetical protein
MAAQGVAEAVLAKPRALFVTALDTDDDMPQTTHVGVPYRLKVTASGPVDLSLGIKLQLAPPQGLSPPPPTLAMRFCAANADCAEGQWCRPLPNPSPPNPSLEKASHCVAYAGEGQACKPPGELLAPYELALCGPQLSCEKGSCTQLKSAMRGHGKKKTAAILIEHQQHQQQASTPAESPFCVLMPAETPTEAASQYSSSLAVAVPRDGEDASFALVCTSCGRRSLQLSASQHGNIDDGNAFAAWASSPFTVLCAGELTLGVELEPVGGYFSQE